ncbi:hypothetical protein [Spirosoma montaniterrae]|uniref:DNA repair ATPase n=1 Tax=Spirosoma montaniterrae TaxID=1178516 RepID=A0A1P9WUJ9_9BACT|nr:hypothetical protein [Spirosoma montaniterrae]AQG79065.1 hypothetical protein AWR27_06840 [Spirosoma montaniterrae]
MKPVHYYVSVLSLSCFLFASVAALAQTVYAGETTVDKVPLKGLNLTLSGDGRQIEKDWENQLRTYGRLTESRGTYRVTNADIAAVSPEPINLVSTVKSSRSSITIFASFDLGSGNFVTPGGTGYNAAEQLLKDFASKTLFAQEVRVAEDGFDEAQKAHQRMVKKGEQLQRDIEANAKEKDRLLKRIDENAKELEQLLKDVETNKGEQTNALTELENRKKNVEAVKAKRQ